MTDLNRSLLWPESVALVGASDDPAKTGGRPMRYLAASGYAGRVYPVNPRRESIDGQKCYPSLADLPEVPDHVYVLTGTDLAIEAVAECGRLGVPVASILADGFAEAGPEGREREDRLRAAAGATRLVGPNSLGVINPRNGLLLTANAAFAEPHLGQGDTFVASHSGSVVGALVSRGLARGISFAGLVSVGGEANLSLGEICLSTVDDEGIGSYALFLESLRHADDLARFASAAAERGKPVVAYKLGRSEQGAALSVSHTGAMAGSDDEAEAFFRAYGIVRVDVLEALIESPALVTRMPAGMPDPRVAVITTTGGGAALVVDNLGRRGIGVRRPSEPLRQRLLGLGAPIGDSLIMDLTLAGAKHEIVSGALDELQRSGEYDLVVMCIGSSARFHPELAVSGVIERAGGPAPLAVFAVPEAPEALASLGAAGVPAFRTPESIAEAIAAAARRPVTVRGAPGPASRPGSLVARPGREAEKPSGGRAVARPGRETGSGDGGSGTLDELDSYRVLAELGIKAQPYAAVSVADAKAGHVPDGTRFPVAVKALSAKLAHKTEAGGVELNVGDPAGVAEAAARIADRTGVDRLLITEMAGDGIDALIGYRVSPDVGPLIMVAAGGVTAELYRDTSLRLAPVDVETAHEMIAEVTGLTPVRGYRGTSGDADALAQAIAALSRLAETSPEVLEAEANPVRVLAPGEGVTALDALVRTSG